MLHADERNGGGVPEEGSGPAAGGGSADVCGRWPTGGTGPGFPADAGCRGGHSPENGIPAERPVCILGGDGDGPGAAGAEAARHSADRESARGPAYRLADGRCSPLCARLDLCLVRGSGCGPDSASETPGTPASPVEASGRKRGLSLGSLREPGAGITSQVADFGPVVAPVEEERRGRDRPGVQKRRGVAPFTQQQRTPRGATDENIRVFIRVRPLRPPNLPPFGLEGDRGAGAEPSPSEPPAPSRFPGPAWEWDARSIWDAPGLAARSAAGSAPDEEDPAREPPPPTGEDDARSDGTACSRQPSRGSLRSRSRSRALAGGGSRAASPPSPVSTTSARSARSRARPLQAGVCPRSSARGASAADGDAGAGAGDALRAFGPAPPRRRVAADRIFAPGDDNGAVYADVAHAMLRGCVRGRNATILAYGQTASGKTHTVLGAAADPGLAPRVAEDIFEAAREEREATGRDVAVSVGYVELYNEHLSDLTSPAAQQGPLHIVEDPLVGPSVRGLAVHRVRGPADVVRLIASAERRRSRAATDANARSTRSHTIFQLLLQSTPQGAAGGGAAGVARFSQLSLVDLAGSERVKRSGARGQRLLEAQHINTSLLVLGTVISKLSDGSRHVPYRDSKLTRLLSHSLGGNAHTAIVCCVSPAVEDYGETVSTLKFASRAQRVTNSVQVNELAAGSSMLLQQYLLEIRQLRAALQRHQAALALRGGARPEGAPEAGGALVLVPADGVDSEEGVETPSGAEGGGGALPAAARARGAFDATAERHSVSSTAARVRAVLERHLRSRSGAAARRLDAVVSEIASAVGHDADGLPAERRREIGEGGGGEAAGHERQGTGGSAEAEADAAALSLQRAPLREGALHLLVRVRATTVAMEGAGAGDPRRAGPPAVEVGIAGGEAVHTFATPGAHVGGVEAGPLRVVLRAWGSAVAAAENAVLRAGLGAGYLLLPLAKALERVHRAWVFAALMRGDWQPLLAPPAEQDGRGRVAGGVEEDGAARGAILEGMVEEAMGSPPLQRRSAADAGDSAALCTRLAEVERELVCALARADEAEGRAAAAEAMSRRHLLSRGGQHQQPESGVGERPEGGPQSAAGASSSGEGASPELVAAWEEIQRLRAQHSDAIAAERASSARAVAAERARADVRARRQRAELLTVAGEVALASAKRAAAAALVFSTPLAGDASLRSGGRGRGGQGAQRACRRQRGGDHASPLAMRVAALLRGDEEVMGSAEAEELRVAAQTGERISRLNVSQRARLRQRVVANELARAASTSVCAELLPGPPGPTTPPSAREAGARDGDGACEPACGGGAEWERCSTARSDAGWKPVAEQAGATHARGDGDDASGPADESGDAGAAAWALGGWEDQTSADGEVWECENDAGAAVETREKEKSDDDGDDEAGRAGEGGKLCVGSRAGGIQGVDEPVPDADAPPASAAEASSGPDRCTMGLMGEVAASDISPDETTERGAGALATRRKDVSCPEDASNAFWQRLEAEAEAEAVPGVRPTGLASPHEEGLSRVIATRAPPASGCERATPARLRRAAIGVLAAQRFWRGGGGARKGVGGGGGSENRVEVTIRRRRYSLRETGGRAEAPERDAPTWRPALWGRPRRPGQDERAAGARVGGSPGPRRVEDGAQDAGAGAPPVAPSPSPATTGGADFDQVPVMGGHVQPDFAPHSPVPTRPEKAPSLERCSAEVLARVRAADDSGGTTGSGARSAAFSPQAGCGVKGLATGDATGGGASPSGESGTAKVPMPQLSPAAAPSQAQLGSRKVRTSRGGAETGMAATSEPSFGERIAAYREQLDALRSQYGEAAARQARQLAQVRAALRLVPGAAGRSRCVDGGEQQSRSACRDGVAPALPSREPRARHLRGRDTVRRVQTPPARRSRGNCGPVLADPAFARARSAGRQGRARAGEGPYLSRASGEGKLSRGDSQPATHSAEVEAGGQQADVRKAMRSASERNKERERLLKEQQEKWRAAGQLRLSPRSRGRPTPAELRRKEALKQGRDWHRQWMSSPQRLELKSKDKPGRPRPTLYVARASGVEAVWPERDVSYLLHALSERKGNVRSLPT